jgi:hypothetical protein
LKAKHAIKKRAPNKIIDKIGVFRADLSDEEEYGDEENSASESDEEEVQTKGKNLRQKARNKI